MPSLTEQRGYEGEIVQDQNRRKSSSGRLALHYMLNQLPNPLLELLLMHRSCLIKKRVVRSGVTRFASGQQGFAPARRAYISQ
jgi:hypothetical protein